MPVRDWGLSLPCDEDLNWSLSLPYDEDLNWSLSLPCGEDLNWEEKAARKRASRCRTRVFDDYICTASRNIDT